MENIIANFVRGGGKPLSYLLAAGLTFAAAQSAQAKMWMGNGSDTLWSTPENWENSTVPAATDSLAFRQSGAPNKTATLNGAYSYTGNMHMGQGSSAAEPYIFVATDAANGLTINDDVWLGYYENGWLWLKSGTYTFGVSSGKGLSLGGDTKTTHRNFWLKVGDGSSTVSLKATARDVNLWGGSTFIADKATLDFTGKSFKVNNTSSAYITNSTMTVGADLNVAGADNSNCSFTGTSSTINLTSNGNVFNVGYGANSAGTVTKDGGDWSCYYLRIANGSGSTGTFTHNGGTLKVDHSAGNSTEEICIGTSGTGVFTLNGGSVTLSPYINQYIGKNSGSSGTLNLNGGTFTARKLRRGNDGATATLNFNGGTLKSNYKDTTGLIAAGVNVNVLAGGGTIDSGNLAVTVCAEIAGAGAMRFKGGNTITLKGANTYTGGTVIELGTKVVASDATAKDTILGNLVVDGRAVLTATTYDVLECSGLTAADLEHITFVNCGAATSAALDDEENPTKIVVTFATPTIVQTTATKVIEGKTLDDIAYGTFTSRMFGKAVSGFEALDSAKGYNKRFTRDGNGSLTKIVVEFQVWSSPYVKCVVVEFTDDGTDVYAKALAARYKQDGTLGFLFYDGSTFYGSKQDDIATAIGGKGYGVCDIRVAVPPTMAWTLDQDRTWSELRGGATLASDTVVCINVTGASPTLTIDENVDVAKIEFVNALVGGVSTNSVAVSGGATVTFGTLTLGQNARVAVPGSFVPSNVSLDAGSKLVYASGEAVATTYSGLGGVEVAPGATLFIDSDVTAPSLLNNGTVVKRTAGTVLMPFNTASTGVTIVSNGTLKVASVAGSGDAYTIRVTNGATFDTNGLTENTVNVVLEGGAKLVNSNAAIGTNKKQTTRLALEGDATATASQNFGLIGSGYAPTTLDLGSNTLTLDGTAGFWLCRTTITGDGTIAVDKGTLQCLYGDSSHHGDTSGENCTMNIGASGKLRIENNVSLTVKNFYNGGNVVAPFKDGNSWYAQGTLVVTGTLTAGNAIPKLTLADGATVKMTGTNNAQTVSTTFNASGTITIDASEITSAQLRNATDGRIPVLTVPSVPSGVTWELSNAPFSGSYLRWEDNILYLCRIRGMMITVR